MRREGLGKGVDFRIFELTAVPAALERGVISAAQPTQRGVLGTVSLGVSLVAVPLGESRAHRVRMVCSRARHTSLAGRPVACADLRGTRTRVRALVMIGDLLVPVP